MYKGKLFWLHIFGFFIKNVIPKGFLHLLMNLYFEGIFLLTIFILFSEERSSLKILSIIRDKIKYLYLCLLGIDKDLQSLENIIRRFKFRNTHRVINFSRFRVSNHSRRNESDNFTWRNNNNNLINRRSSILPERLLHTDTICVTHQLYGRYSKRCTATCRWRHALLCRDHKNLGVRSQRCTQPCHWDAIATPAQFR